MSSSSNPVVFDTHGRPFRLARVIGQGAQGTAWEEESGHYVVKLVSVRDEAGRRELARRFHWLVDRVLHIETRVVKPEAVLAAPATGFIMPRVKGHEPLSRLLAPPTNGGFAQWYHRGTGGLRRRLLLAGALARSFHYLHRDRLAYCDLSDSNVLVARETSKVSIALIDPDNLSETGTAQSLVLGTPRYMAPELLRGSHQPDSLTDSHSLAVLLFQLLRLGHPLLGDEILDAAPEEEEVALRGDRPYVDDPDDQSNSSGQVLPAVATSSSGLVRLFLRAFVEGLTQRMRRPTPAEWENACVQAAENTQLCKECAASFLPQPEFFVQGGVRCPWCGRTNPQPPRLLFRDVVLVQGEPLTRKASSLVLRPGENFVSNRHTRGVTLGLGEIRTELTMTVHENGVFAAENRSDQPILIQLPGSIRSVPLRAGESMELPAGAGVYFGQPNAERTVRFARLVSPVGNHAGE